MTKQDFKIMWNTFLVKIDKTTKDVADDMGIAPPNLQQKIRNQSIKYHDLAEIVEKYGYTIEIREKE